MDANTFTTAMQNLRDEDRSLITRYASKKINVYVVQSLSTQLLTIVRTHRDARQEVGRISKRYQDNHIIHGIYVHNIEEVLNIMKVLMNENKIKRQYILADQNTRSEIWYSHCNVQYIIKLMSDTDISITNYRLEHASNNIVARSGGHANKEIDSEDEL